ncbi:hypothetical protein SA2149_05945 [Aggregatibacter actinomycetemcomitans serotype e str. SA2149]|nr:hypothetical protein SA2149_05945 [Aggregatibacter actinomycetemcomitans serotype e str. SA2149]KYK79809.1 hypothetical protein SC383S_05425 [Aggregatibacter actinomycetemcomitans SC383s]
MRFLNGSAAANLSAHLLHVGGGLMEKIVVNPSKLPG